MPKGTAVPRYQMTIFKTDFISGGSGRKYKPDIVQKTRKKPAAKITDPFGEHIGGARKELWYGRGITREDIAAMNSMEREKYIKKDNIWKKPDYADMIKKGISAEVVYAIKKIRDSFMPSLPRYRVDNTEELRLKRQEEYTAFCSEVRDMAMGITSEEGLYGIFENFLIGGGYAVKSGTSVIPTQKSAPFLTKKLFNSLYVTEATIRKYRHDIKKTGFGLGTDNSRRKASGRKKMFLPKQLQNIERIGLDDVRRGRDITGQDFIDVYKIRGGEFGNWLSGRDAQSSLNMAYEALHDFSKALGILPEQVSFGGRLSIAFGARGKGKAAAHYEPMREVINVTKMNGAGSLGHELFHALDDIIGKKLGLNGMMTEKWERQDKIPYSVFKLVQTMCFRDETPIEQEKRSERECRQYKAYIQHIAGRFLPDSMLTDEQAAKKEEIIKKIITEAECKSGDTSSDVCLCDSAQLLSDFCREVTGHRTPKKGMDELLVMWRCYITVLANARKKALMKVPSDYMDNSKKMDGIYSRDSFGYWSSLCEMFARAGACFLNDRLKEIGGRCDYLCGHSESCASLCTAPDGNTETIRAVPLGRERAAINSAMEDMITDLRERGLFLSDVERAGMVRGSAKARLENGCILEVSYCSGSGASKGCDTCVGYSLYDGNGFLTDSGEMDYDSDEFKGSDVAVMIPKVLGFCLGKEKMGYMLMAVE